MLIATFLIGWASFPTFERWEVRWVATAFDWHWANERECDIPNHVQVMCRHVMFTADEKCQPLRNLLYELNLQLSFVGLGIIRVFSTPASSCGKLLSVALLAYSSISICEFQVSWDGDICSACCRVISRWKEGDLKTNWGLFPLWSVSFLVMPCPFLVQPCPFLNSYS